MCAKEQAESAAAAASSTETSLLDTILKQGMRARDDLAVERGQDLLKELVGQLLDPSRVVAKDTEHTSNLRIAEIDRLLSTQLNEIMHNEGFQKLEGSWRGLKYLVDQTETST